MYLHVALDQVDADASSETMPSPVHEPGDDISRCSGEEAREKLAKLGLLGWL